MMSLLPTATALSRFARGVAGLLAASLGVDPAVVLHAEEPSRSAGPQETEQTAVTQPAAEDVVAGTRLVAWPLGAPEALRRHIELQRVQEKTKVAPPLQALNPKP